MVAKLTLLFVFLTFPTKCNPQPNILELLNTVQGLFSGGAVNYMDVLQGFMANQNLNVQDLMRYAQLFAKLSDNPVLQNLVENPMDLMMTVQRLGADWQHVDELFAIPTVHGEALQGLLRYAKGPSAKPHEEDLNEVALAVVRIQDVYNLSIPALLSGKFGYFKPDTPLTVNEHIRLGQQSLFNWDLDLAVAWFEKALILKGSNNKKLKSKADKSIAKLKEMKGLLQSGLDLLTPQFLQSLSVIPGIPTEMLHRLIDKINMDHPDNKMRNTYKKLCRGEALNSGVKKPTLHCMYIRHDTTGDLQRVKIEYLSHNPLVAILHDVVSDKEIETIKKLAIPKLEPVKIHKFDNIGDMRASPVRTGKSAWVHKNSNSVIENLFRRVEDFTGLLTTNAEPLQVMHYGIGGHYEVHTDFFNTYSKKSDLVPSDRIATLLLYLSDVYAGGYTVFPHLELSVKPEKGSALFWFNLLRRGEGDFRMVHAACPVLSTNKWAANLWIADKDQIFQRPCSLQKDE